METRRFGPYRVESTLGRGGMGVVYRATHEGTGIAVALKTVLVAAGPALEDLRREVAALARIHHPGIVRVLDQGIDEGIPWYAMEIVDGPTLRAVTRELWREAGDADPAPRGDLHDTSTLALASVEGASACEGTDGPVEDDAAIPMAAAGRLAEALGLAAGICEPLAFLHGEGLVHRDLKPENVIVSPRRGPVLLDLGLARRFHAAGGRELLDVSPVAGTAAYMAPEQCKGEPSDARADLYALGCILHELLTGRPPFGTADASALIGHHVATPPPAASSRASGVSEALDALLASLLAKDPSERPGHAGAVARVLHDLGAPRAVADAAPPPRPYLFVPPLVGRDAELEQIGRAVAAVARGEGGALQLEGEGGSGKTRLAREAATLGQLRGVAVVAEACDPGGAAGSRAPLAAASSLFRHVHARILRRGRGRDADTAASEGALRLLGRDAAILAQHVPILASIPGLDGLAPQADDAERRTQLVHALARTVRNLATERPLLWILDDVASADPVTTGALAMLQEEGLTDLPLLVLGTRRPSHPPTLGTAPSIHVGPLEPVALERMAAGMLAARPPAELVQALARDTEGNPLFLAEYLRSAIDAGILVHDRFGRWIRPASADGALRPMALPTSLRGLLEGRLAALSAEETSIVELAALSFAEVDARLLAATGISDAHVLGSIHELSRLSILVAAGGSVRFAHGKLREVALERIPAARRAGLHATLARAIDALPEEERRPRLLALARHREESGERDRAATAYLAAGTLAVADLAWEHADEAFAGARRLCDPSRRRALLPALLSWGGRVLPCLGRPERALEVLAEAAALAREHADAATALDASIASASVLRNMGRLAEAASLLEQLLPAARDAGDAALGGRALGVLASVHLQRGEVLRAAEVIGEARTLLPRIAEPSTRALLAQEEALLRLFEGRLDDAARGLEEARILARAGRSSHVERRCLVNLGNVRYRQGRVLEAARDYEEARGLAAGCGDRQMEALALANLGQMCAELGRTAEAEAHHLRALKLHRLMRARPMEALVLTNLALLRLHEARAEEALSLFQESIAISREIGDLRAVSIALVNVAEARKALADLPRALAAAREALRIARELGIPQQEGIALLVLGSIEHLAEGPTDAVVATLARATAMARSCGALVSALDATCLEGHVALDRGEEATDHLARARALADDLGLDEASRAGIAIAILARAIEARGVGRPLLRGMDPDDVPPALAALLRERLGQELSRQSIDRQGV